MMFTYAEATGHDEPREIVEIIKNYDEKECQRFYEKMDTLHVVMGQRKSTASETLSKYKTSRKALGLEK